MKTVLMICMALVLAGGTMAPAAEDYNGDGTDDIAIFRASSGLWAVRGVSRFYFGGIGDMPYPADYNGNGTDSAAIFRAASGLWAVRGVTRVYFGSGSDEPKPGDYNGDGSDEVCIFRRDSGLWAVKGLTRVYFGTSSDAALPSGKQCRLTVTGQTTISRTGDDGYYQAGSAFNFQQLSIGGDLVTIDHNTGLIWAADGNEAGCFNGQTANWDDAIDYCNNLNFAGYTDWRLPNWIELESLIDTGRKVPAIDTTYFPNTKSEYYWSSSTYIYWDTYARWVHFDGGQGYTGVKTNGYYLRAVRGGL